MHRALFAFIALGFLPLAGCVKDVPAYDFGKSVSASAPPRPTSAFGQVDSIVPVDGGYRFALNATRIDCELRAGTWGVIADVNLTALGELPDPGAIAGVWAMRNTPESNWTIVRFLETPEAYAESCVGNHAFDLQVLGDGAAMSIPSGSAMRVIPTEITLGGETAVALRFQNTQDVALTARIVDLALLNSELVAYRAPQHYQSGLEGPPPAAVDGCSLAYPKGDIVVLANATIPVAVRIECREDAEATPTHEACEGWRPAPPGGDATPPACETRAARPEVTLWGRVAFTDELGREHLTPNERGDALLQPLTLARPATLTVSVPARVASGDEYRVVARYLDASGAPISDAQATVFLTHPDIADHGLGMRYDAAEGAYVSAWDDYMEWKPWFWKEGTYTVRVEAGYGAGLHGFRVATATVEFV